MHWNTFGMFEYGGEWENESPRENIIFANQQRKWWSIENTHSHAHIPSAFCKTFESICFWNRYSAWWRQSEIKTEREWEKRGKSNGCSLLWMLRTIYFGETAHEFVLVLFGFVRFGFDEMKRFVYRLIFPISSGFNCGLIVNFCTVQILWKQFRYGYTYAVLCHDMLCIINVYHTYTHICTCVRSFINVYSERIFND